MRAIEFETRIDLSGRINLPERFRDAYGKMARLVVLLQERHEEADKTIDPMQYAGVLDWPVDGLDYQAQCRDEWK